MTEPDITTEMIDPESPVKFVRLLVDGEEQAMIPWNEARAIARCVENNE